jgi:CRP-like cAMP-binding protein
MPHQLVSGQSGGTRMTSAATVALPPAITRLAALAPLDAEDMAALQAATAAGIRRIPARREVLGEGHPVPQAQIVLSGWACRVQMLSDGRRQIVSLMLPGDLIGMCRQRDPLASSSVLALTDVVTCLAPEPRQGQHGTGLAEAYAVSGALDELYLLRHITRLGRLSAYERTADLLLEIHERLTLAGIASGNMFPMPLTQEMLADTLGLTSVHVNRTLQTMRRDGSVSLRAGTAVLSDPAHLANMVDRRPPRVTSR